jgi:hypothetical protein
MESPDGIEPHVQFTIDRPFIAMEWDDRQWDVSGWDGMTVSGAYVFDDNVYFFLDAPINHDDPEKLKIEFFPGELKYELLATKAVCIKTIPVNGSEIVFFAATNNDNQIILYAYEKSTREYISEKEFGDIRLYEAVDLIETLDGGLAILGVTSVVDQLDRICLFKLSKAEVEAMVR